MTPSSVSLKQEVSFHVKEGGHPNGQRRASPYKQTRDLFR